MLQSFGKSASLGRVTFQAVPALGSVNPSPINHNNAYVAKPTSNAIPPPTPITSYGLSQVMNGLSPSITSGIGVTTSVRRLHNDMQVPDFTEYRRDACASPYSKNSESHAARSLFSYALIGSMGTVGVYSGKHIVNLFIDSMNPSASVMALSKIEVDTSNIPEGKNMTFKWRGKPVFVRHRTADEIAIEQSVDPATLRDPEADQNRVTKDKWLVVLGICTHLGCVPIANAGEFGGYYCPCHGSHYDASGRIRKGPAPMNLEVPPYQFVEENLLVVG